MPEDRTMSNLSSCIESIKADDPSKFPYTYTRPSNWPNLEDLYEQTKKEGYYHYIMLIDCDYANGDASTSSFSYLTQPATSTAFRWVRTSWGVDEAAKSTTVRHNFYEHEGIQWIAAYAEISTVTAWAPTTTYNMGLVAWYGPDVCFSSTNGYRDAYTLRELVAKEATIVATGFQYAGAIVSKFDIKSNVLSVTGQNPSTNIIAWCADFENLSINLTYPLPTIAGTLLNANKRFGKPPTMIGTNKLTSWHGLYRDNYRMTEIGDVSAIANTTMYYSFGNDYALTSIGDISMPACKTAEGMAAQCFALRKVGKVTFTDQLTTFYSTFYNCPTLSSVELDVDTVNVTSMQSMFNGCNMIKSVDMTGAKPYIDGTNLKSLQGTFYNCIQLERIPEFRNTHQLTSLYQTFYNCRNLKELPDLDTSKVTTMT